MRTQYQGNKVIKTLTEYQYDAFGRRIHKHSETRRFTQSNQSKDQLRQTNKTQHQHTHMLWDSDLPIQEYTDTHVYTTIYEQGSFNPVARLAWLRDDMPEPMNDEAEVVQDNPHIKIKVEPKFKVQVYHYHNDQLGTPNELTNDKGEVVWLADYETWGNTAKLIWREEKLEQLRVSSDELQPIRFQGKHFDEETGLHYYRFRYYDPDMGMFTTRDPIGLMGGDNVFAYAPNPTGWVDPLGLNYTMDSLGAITGQSAASMNYMASNPPQPVKISSGFNGPFGNVCGAEGTKLATWIPDGYWWIFVKACKEHDECYSQCGNTKNFCDIQFLKRGAVLYAGAVMASKDSKEAYNSAQKKAGCCSECIS